jgi:hypothetical protein
MPRSQVEGADRQGYWPIWIQNRSVWPDRASSEQPNILAISKETGKPHVASVLQVSGR